jgi:thioredoxin 1
MPFYIEIHDNETFDTVTKGSAVCVVDFYTSWCGPCKKLAPLLEETIKEHSDLRRLHTNEFTDLDVLKKKVTFVKVNIENHQELADKFKVSSIPLICFYKNGVLCREKVVGANLDSIMTNVVKLTADLVNVQEQNESDELPISE